VRLLVEGPDDKHVVAHLLRRRHPAFDHNRITDLGGITKVLDELSVFLKGSEDFGVIIDANTSIDSRWTAVRDRAMKAGYVMPLVPDSDGVIATGEGRPRFGVWIMPDNRLPGTLEHFVRELVPKNDDLWPLADRAVNDMPEKQRRFKPAAHLKAIIQTWLAWQEEPGTPMGAAISQHYLQTDSALADRFVQWVVKLSESVS